MGLRARARRDLPGGADADALDRLDRDHRLRDPAVEPIRPGDVGAEPRHEPPGARLERPAEALVLLPEPVDLGDHRRRRRSVEAADRIVVDGVEVGGPEIRGSRSVDAGDPGHVASDRHPDRRQELPGEGAGGDARRGLAGAGPLEDVAGVVEAVLEEAGEVGVAGTRQVDLLDALAALPRAPSARPSSRSRGWRRAARSGCRASGRGGRRSGPRRVSFSIFIRPPRPWPSWRRAMSRSSASRSSSRPAGMPSTIVVSPGPWDSPAVTKSKRAIGAER